MDVGNWSSGLLNLAYACILGEARWEEFLAGLAAGLPNGKATLFTHDPVLQCGAYTLAAGFEPAHLASYETYYAKINPWMHRIDERPIGVAVRSDAMLPREALLRTEFYAGFLKPQGLEAGYGITIHAEGSARFMLSMLHADTGFERDEAATRVLAALQPHLARAFRFARRGGADGLPCSLDRKLVDALKAAVLYLSAERRIVYANVPARSQLQRGDGLALDPSGRLSVADADCAAAINDLLLWSRAWTRPTVRTARIRRQHGRPLQVLLLRPSRQSAEMFFAGSLLILIVIEPGASTPACAGSLGMAYGLTPAECRLVDGLLRGLRLEEIAQVRKISKETVRTQLRSVLAKMGVRGQADIIREALFSPSALFEEQDAATQEIARNVEQPARDTREVSGDRLAASPKA